MFLALLPVSFCVGDSVVLFGSLNEFFSESLLNIRICSIDSANFVSNVLAVLYLLFFLFAEIFELLLQTRSIFLAESTAKYQHLTFLVTLCSILLLNHIRVLIFFVGSYQVHGSENFEFKFEFWREAR